MTGKMGMESGLYKDRSLEIARDLNGLCGDLYAAIDEDVPVGEVYDLIAASEKKIALFESLLADTTGGLHDGLPKKYGDEIEAIKNFSSQLRAKYGADI